MYRVDQAPPAAAVDEGQRRVDGAEVSGLEHAGLLGNGGLARMVVGGVGDGVAGEGGDGVDERVDGAEVRRLEPAGVRLRG